MSTVGRWFGPPERPLLGWLSRPPVAVTSVGVAILPAVGYPYWSSHRTLRTIAERLVGSGHTVLRFDYDGCGDSDGDQWDCERLAAWRASVVAAAAELRAIGCRELVLVGVRLGGLLALIEAPGIGAATVVAWEPVSSGRRYVREIRLLATAMPATQPDRPRGTMVAAGVVFTPQTLEDLSALGLGDVAAAAPRTLIVGDREDRELLEHLRGLGAHVEQRLLDGRLALEVPAEDATVPTAIVESICAWIGPAASGTPGRPPAQRSRAQLSSAGEALAEEVVTLGPDRLVGVISEADALADDALTVVFLNSGSEPHIGSGRSWVEYARTLAVLGYRTVRTDFRGWGESPDDGFAPGRPYDAHCEEDTITIVRALRERGHERVVLVGLCAGAWVALRAVLREPPAGVIALNPQLYWQPGDPVEALMADTRVRRTAEREREQRGGRCGVWTALDVLGQRPWAARWLDELVRAAVPISLLFAEGDDGLEYLRNRVARRLAHAQRSGVVSIVEMAGIDHSMHRAWLRERVIAAIREQLEALSNG